MSTTRTPAEPVLPEPPAGHVWIDRGYGWTNDGKPTVHCVKSPRSARIVNSKAAIKPAGGADFRFWEAVKPDVFTEFAETLRPDTVIPMSQGLPENVSRLIQSCPSEAEIEAVHRMGAEAAEKLFTKPPTPERTITVVHAIPQPPASVVPVSDPAFDAVWSSWRSSKAGQENANVRGLDVSRLWTIMEARIRAAFEAGWNSK